MTYSSERRRLYRMKMRVECSCQLTELASGEISAAVVKDLSGGGALVWCDHEVPTGTRIAIRIAAAGVGRAPLLADAVVARCDPAEATGHFALACEFTDVR